MNSVELLEKKTALVNEARNLCNNCKVEIRKLTPDEAGRIENIKSEIININEQLRALDVELPKETENNISSNIRQKMNKTFSLLTAIRNVAENKQQDDR